jgi:target of EGR1 protein 1
VSFGVSTFTRRDSDSTRYAVQNFEFLVISQTEFQVSPQSLKFLAQNGFDLNRLVCDGIPYLPGAIDDAIKKPTDQPSNAARANTELLRHLFDCLMKRCRDAPLVVHNGFLDLMFIYHAFYGPLPATLPTFIADISSMFGAGVYDTKYVSDYVTRESQSFLAYLHRKYERHYAQTKQLTFEIAPAIETSAVVRPPPPSTSEPFCKQFALHGHCNQGMDCASSHNLDLILDYEEAGRSKPGKRKVADMLYEGAYVTEIEMAVLVDAQDKVHHTAYFDAYMTGCVFAHQRIMHRDEYEGDVPTLWRNRVYLIGKSLPLLFEKSQFSNFSAHHRSRLESLAE